MPNLTGVALSPAGQQLGLGNMLQNQTQDELEAERKRRMLQNRQESLRGASPAMQLLTGSLAGMGRGY
jgi:hypothetical protein